jgi:hypothetical protein
MQHNVQTLIDDLENSIPEVPNIEKMEAAEAELAKAARPKWEDDELFDIDRALAGAVGEVVPVPFSKLSRGPLMSQETSTDEVARIAAAALRRMAGGNDDDFRKTDDVEPDEEDDEQEIPPDDQVKADVAFLKSKLAEGVSLWQYTSDVLESDYARGAQLRRALAFLCDQRPELLDAA